MVARRGSEGLTLIELMVTVAVLAIATAIAYPSFNGVIHSNRLAGATNSMLAALNLARSEAVRSNRGAGICPTLAGAKCEGTDWSRSLVVFLDHDGSGGWSDGDAVVRFFEPNEALSLVVAKAGGSDAEAIPAVAFDRTGRVGAALDFIVAPKECSGAATEQRRVQLTRVGQVKVAKQKEDCSDESA